MAVAETSRARRGCTTARIARGNSTPESIGHAATSTDHTVWFEWHEELIGAAGLTREQAARSGDAQ